MNKTAITALNELKSRQSVTPDFGTTNTTKIDKEQIKLCREQQAILREMWAHLTGVKRGLGYTFEEMVPKLWARIEGLRAACGGLDGFVDDPSDPNFDPWSEDCVTRWEQSLIGMIKWAAGEPLDELISDTP